jgi:hypothetical protein
MYIDGGTINLFETKNETNMMEADNQEDLINMSYNASNFNFEVLFEYRPLKIVGIGFASVSTLFIIFLSYGIIWFERFGSGK